MVSKVWWINRSTPHSRRMDASAEKALWPLLKHRPPSTLQRFPPISLFCHDGPLLLERRGSSLLTCVGEEWLLLLFSHISFAPFWPIFIVRCDRKRCYFLTVILTYILWICCFIIDSINILMSLPEVYRYHNVIQASEIKKKKLFNGARNIAYMWDQ